MDIKDKLYLDREGLQKHGPITIVAFGDSITHGAFLNGMDYEHVYWNLLRKKLLAVRDYVPVNVINAGIGGIDAAESIGRVDEQVLRHKPDLIIICFGLNDVNGPLNTFLEALCTIFEKCKKSEANLIFMTPNMLNTYVAEDTPKKYLDYAAVTAEYQNSGKMDTYMDAAKQAAEKMGIKVCDCYSMWKKLSETQDTTMLLANRINHPAKEMHELFADSLFHMIFDHDISKASENSSLMYNYKKDSLKKA